MRKKQAQQKIETPTRVVAIAGSALVVLGCFASIYGTHVNQRFITFPAIDLIYYLRYLLLLGGGFIIGYFLVRVDIMKSRQESIFRGVVYGLFAMALYTVLDSLRAVYLQGFPYHYSGGDSYSKECLLWLLL